MLLDDTFDLDDYVAQAVAEAATRALPCNTNSRIWCLVTNEAATRHQIREFSDPTASQESRPVTAQPYASGCDLGLPVVRIWPNNTDSPRGRAPR